MTFRGRRGLRLDGGALEAIVLPGGGHVASLRLPGGINPLWEPAWPGLEPEDWDPARHAADYGLGEGRLLASLAGHNLCLDHFGELSPAEVAAGACFHGEAPNRPWTVTDSGARDDQAWLTYGLECPEAGVRFLRTLRLRAGTTSVRFDEEVVNLRPRDCPLGWQQHVTLGPPFVEPGVTRLDLPATRGRTFPRSQGPSDPLKPDSDFRWPEAPAAAGGAVRVDRYPAAPSCSVSSVLLEPGNGAGFLAAANPELGLLVVYAFDAALYPWTALWVENRATDAKPYAGKSVAWGVEFGTVAMPVTRMETLAAGPLFGRPRFAVLPARGTLRTTFHAALARIPSDWAGTADVRQSAGRMIIVERQAGRPIQVALP